MSLLLKILSYFYLYAGVCCVHQVSWLPCQFTDEHVFMNAEGHTETQLIHRKAMLQFGHIGDAPVSPGAVTFLISGSKLDLRRFFEGEEAELLECELRRFSTDGIHVHWPSGGPLGATSYNRWFICTFSHTKGRFTVTGFLRVPSDQPPPGQQDYRRWPAILDGETFSTSVAMVIKTLSPSVRATLGSQQTLHCQFAVDHKAPNASVEWHRQHRGERTSLFSYSSRKGQSQGTGVRLRGLASGDASYNLPFTKISSEGNYICSVEVLPLFTSLEINLQIEEPPRVSLSVGPVLSLLQGAEQRVSCDAQGYYPLDVEMVWTVQDPAVAAQRVGAPLPEVLQNVLLSSHKHNQDQTFSLAAFFYLQASLGDSGKQFTCSVSHQSLRMPIKKSFILTVEEPLSWTFSLAVGLLLLSLVVVLYVLLRYLCSARKLSVQKKPY